MHVEQVWLIGVLMLTTGLSENTEVGDRFEARVYRDAGGGELPYRLLKPNPYNPHRPYPMVLFLHGAGERGNDNRVQLVHGMAEFASDSIMREYPCFVVAPQCPDGMQWVDTPWTADDHQMPELPTPALRQALELLDRLQEEFSVDPSRLYLTGLSMGGFGVWDAIQRNPDRFAAAAPVCGGGDVRLAKHIAHVPVWAFHGGQDPVVKPRRSRDMIAAVREAGGDPKYTEYADAGHDSWTDTYRDPELYRWMFAQRRRTPN